MENAIILGVGGERLEERGVECESCLICNGALVTSTSAPSFSNTSTQEQSILEKHLEIILLLKNVFELPSEQLVHFLGNFPNVENWIKTCDNCEQLVNQFKSLHEQMVGVKMKIIKTMKASFTPWKDDTTDWNLKRNDKQYNEGLIPSVTDECRQFVKKHEYYRITMTNDISSTPNYCEDIPPEVKQEIKDDTSDDSEDDNSLARSPGSEIEFDDQYPEDENSDYESEKISPPTRKSARISSAVTLADNDTTTTAARVNLPQPELPCPKCDKSFPTRTTLNRHITTDHKNLPDIASRTCTACDILFFDNPTLRRHLVKKHGHLRQPKIDFGTETKCRECSKVFKKPCLLYHHVEQIHKKSYTNLCDLCGKEFTAKSGLKNHREICGTRKLEDGTSKKRTKCPVDGCYIYFLREKLLQKHVKEHQSPPTWKCGNAQCSKMFHTKKLLSKHEMVEHGIGFICEHCGKLFHQQLLLRIHQETTLKCKLLRQDAWKVDPNLKCDKCGRMFASLNNLKKHVKVIHEKKFDWKCDKCGENFVDRNWLQFHLKKEHNVGEYKWRCPVVEGCGKGFLYKSMLDSHMAVHGGGKGVKCGKCGKGFGNKGRLGAHKRKVHGMREKVSCEICGKMFKAQIYLNVHLRNSHKIL